jgi:predicted nucleic acid-binding protein
MIFSALPSGESVFVDANPFVYHFSPHPVLGPACNQLLKRIEQKDLHAFTSAHVLSEVAHRLMTFEAITRFGWSPGKLTLRLRQNPAAVQQLVHFRQAIEEIVQLGIPVLPISGALVVQAAPLSQQTGLLSNDALIVAVMQANGLTNLASGDADFDRVPGLTRYAPA